MTAVPAAIGGLISRLEGASSLTGVRVMDGPWVQRPSEPEIVVVGWLPDEGATVEWSADPASLAVDDDSERFTIRNLVSVWRGDTNTKAARDRADEILEYVRAEVRADPTLDQAVSRAHLNTVDATAYQTDQGCEYVIAFTIRAQLF